MPWTWHWACREVTITASTHLHLHIPLVSSLKHVMELALHEFSVMQMMQGSSTTDHTRNGLAVKLLDFIVPGYCRYIYNHKSCGLCGSAVRTWDMAARTCYACEVCQPLNKGTILDTSRSKALSAAKDSKVVTCADLFRVMWLRTHFT